MISHKRCRSGRFGLELLDGSTAKARMRRAGYVKPPTVALEKEQLKNTGVDQNEAMRQDAARWMQDLRLDKDCLVEILVRENELRLSDEYQDRYRVSLLVVSPARPVVSSRYTEVQDRPPGLQMHITEELQARAVSEKLQNVLG